MAFRSSFTSLLKLGSFALAIGVAYKVLASRWMGQSLSLPGFARAKGAKVVDLLTIDAKGLQCLLGRGEITNLDLVRRYLAQIQRHDGKLRAMIKVTPSDILEETAKSLDRERAAGRLRGPLHGIPIIIKVGGPGNDPAPFTLLISSGQH